jgi:hypothetical protein
MLSGTTEHLHIREKKCLIRFKDIGVSPQLVRAATVEIHDEHLVFLRSGGELSALYLFEMVRDWSEVYEDARSHKA